MVKDRKTVIRLFLQGFYFHFETEKQLHICPTLNQISHQTATLVSFNTNFLYIHSQNNKVQQHQHNFMTKKTDRGRQIKIWDTELSALQEEAVEIKTAHGNY